MVNKMRQMSMLFLRRFTAERNKGFFREISPDICTVPGCFAPLKCIIHIHIIF